MLTVLDYAMLAVLGVSALCGAWRGLVSEVFGLIGWIVAFIAARYYAGAVAPYIPATWPGGAMTQWLVAFALVVIAVMIISAALNAVLTRLTAASGLRGVDRSLGMLFGLARGMLIVLVAVALGSLTELPQQPFWRDSVLRPYADEGITALKPILPAPLAAYVNT